MNTPTVTALFRTLTAADLVTQPEDGVSHNRLVLADGLADDGRYWEEGIARSRHPICVRGDVETGILTGGYVREEEVLPGETVPVFYNLADGRCLCAACFNGENGCPVLLPEAEGDPEWAMTGSYTANCAGEPETCCHCDAPIPSKYGTDDADLIELDETGRMVTATGDPLR